jgi:hypothetical protein
VSEASDFPGYLVNTQFLINKSAFSRRTSVSVFRTQDNITNYDHHTRSKIRRLRVVLLSLLLLLLQWTTAALVGNWETRRNDGALATATSYCYVIQLDSLCVTMIVKKRETTSKICFVVMMMAFIFSRFEYGDASWVDPDTPEAGLTTAPLTKGDEREYTLVSVLLCWYVDVVV